MDNIIQTQNLTKVYGKGEAAVAALNNVNVSIQNGKMTAIIGSSGSGKSTLLNIIGGLDRNATGKAFLNDVNLLTMSDSELSKTRTQKIGFVFQFFKLIPELTAKENILLPAMIDKRIKIDDSVMELAEKLQIENRLSHYPSQLSGGQQQRVAIARALINNPDVLLCDEPTGNLDENSGGEVMKLLTDFCVNLNKTIVIVTHDMNIAKQCDNTITISDGKIVS